MTVLAVGFQPASSPAGEVMTLKNSSLPARSPAVGVGGGESVGSCLLQAPS